MSHHSKGKNEEDWSIRLIKVVSFMVVFMAGAVLGLSLTSHITPYFHTQSELFFPKRMYSTNCAKDNTSLASFVSPSNLMHDMSDDELFWRASLVPKKEKFPFKRVPKVAFMFMTRGALPLLKLWEMFFAGHEGFYSIYVHSLPGYKLIVNDSSPFYGRQIRSEETSWGSISLVDAEKRLLANALLDFSNERFVLISESCIPVFNFPNVYNYLVNSIHSFVESYDEDSPRGRGRYSRRMWPDIKLSKWRKGSEWFELNRELAVNIVADFKYYNLFRKYCKPSCYPDEHYIPTYLNMFYGALNSNRTVTWVDWSRGGPHPARYGHRAITEEFIQSIRENATLCSYNFEETSMCYLFARKFAPSALEPLLRLASTLMEF
ncbi:uncharacterized protein A4U43_C09F3660 [Asparagus officinalis]|uniref:Core-2/I-branching beta-1,6-N-acetylglucosaminyltransferase family protein n=1 Tax=Asparagus officinalis TaxID=4686 RepID=A0A5P1E8D3_ASPOF|nr:uncharacterized protein LOC109824416 [Asparagus officinalis]ONK57745.1 uncharacterized protein A4U43_C09F3660 [Asparagus officinalis]